MFIPILLWCFAGGATPALDAHESQRLVSLAEQHVVNYRKAFPPKTVFATDPETGIPVPQPQVWSDGLNPLVGRTVTLKIDFDHVASDDRSDFAAMTGCGDQAIVDVLVGQLTAQYHDDFEVADLDRAAGRQLTADDDRIAELEDDIGAARARSRSAEQRLREYTPRGPVAGRRGGGQVKPDDMQIQRNRLVVRFPAIPQWRPALGRFRPYRVSPPLHDPPLGERRCEGPPQAAPDSPSQPPSDPFPFDRASRARYDRDRARDDMARQRGIEEAAAEEQGYLSDRRRAVERRHRETIGEARHTVRLAVPAAFFPVTRMPRAFEAAMTVHAVTWDRAAALPTLVIYAELLASDDLDWPRSLASAPEISAEP